MRAIVTRCGALTRPRITRGQPLHHIYEVTALIGQGGELRGHLGVSASYPGNGT